MERQPPKRTSHARAAMVRLLLIAVVLANAGGLPYCGLTVFAETGENAAITADATGESDTDITGDATATDATDTTPPPLPPYPQDMRDELFPVDVQTIIDGDTRQIVKTYALSDGENPADISRESFIRDGWQYDLTDVVHRRVSSADTREHVEAVTISTDTNDLNAILKQLAPTLDYTSEDSYIGVLSLDLSSVTCEIAGQKKESYTVSATREYPHLPSNDTSLIPKNITENGRTLQLVDVAWAAERSDNVDYEDVATTYRATAKYTGSASKSVVTGYVTTAQYIGEVVKLIEGGAVYTAYFTGSKFESETPTPTESATAAPTETATATPTDEPTAQPTATPAATEAASATAAPNGGGTGDNTALFAALKNIGIIAIIAALLIIGGVCFFMWRNVKVYALKDGIRTFAARVRVRTKAPTADLSKLSGGAFLLDIGKLSAKMLSGKTVELTNGVKTLKHVVAYEGNAYTIEADFDKGVIKAVY